MKVTHCHKVVFDTLGVAAHRTISEPHHTHTHRLPQTHHANIYLPFAEYPRWQEHHALCTGKRVSSVFHPMTPTKFPKAAANSGVFLLREDWEATCFETLPLLTSD